MAFFIILSIENNMEEEKLALGRALLTSSFLRIRINEYNCLSVMERGGGGRRQVFEGENSRFLKKSCRLKKLLSMKNYLRQILKLWCPGAGDQIPFVQRGLHF